MKILHVAPNAPYNENWGYQENLLPYYHQKMGHQVSVIVTDTMHKNGKIVRVKCDDHLLPNGIRLIRLTPKKYCINVLTSLKSKLQIRSYLEELQPDLVFFHGLISDTIFDVIHYKKFVNTSCIIIQDNHMDYYNGYGVGGIKNKIVRWYNRCRNKRSIQFVDKVYGVTPWRIEYANDYFGIPKNKLDLLIMGADDEKIKLDSKNQIRSEIRSKLNIDDDQFMIITGGKIDKNKNIDILIRACSGIDGVKLIVFGDVSKDFEIEFNDALNSSSNTLYIGWVSSDKVYDYFMSSDLICFPGTHSVMWEQACACKVPCLFKKWEGMTHVNNGGNSAFISEITENDIRTAILRLNRTSEYKNMQKMALSNATDIYLYSNIAKKSLECAEKK